MRQRKAIHGKMPATAILPTSCPGSNSRVTSDDPY
jgi:hypothetical protein